MAGEDVYARERAFWDAQAASRDPGAMPPRAPDPFEESMLRALGPVEGLRVLELGCGQGDLSLELLRRGARLTALDLAPEMVRLARARAERFRPESRDARFVVAPAEDTGLAAESFDRVVGKWVLHHVDLAAAAREVRRLLVPGGRGVFFENQARNPVLSFARRRLMHVPGVHQVGTRDEHPLTRQEVDDLSGLFSAVAVEYPNFYFFEALSRALRHRGLQGTQRLDFLVWRRLPRLRPYGYHVLVVVER